MANVKMGDFLLQYYMQRRFNTMPATVRAQFDAYAKSDDFRGNMKDWKKKLMHTDANGKLVENTMPDSAPPPPHPDDLTGNMTMTDDEWEKLFKAFQNAFRNMSANADSFKDNAKATSFLKEHFGDPNTHLFANAVADPVNAEPLIQGAFKKFLEDHKNSLEIYFKQWGLIDSDFSYSDLMSGIKSKKYNTDPAFQDKVKTVAQYLNVYGRQADFQTAIGIHPGATIPDFTQIENGFDSGTVDPNKLDYFKRNYKDFLNTLTTESKVYDVFKQYDKGKISKHLDAANGKVDYANKDSKDYVPPKRDDELTPWQRLKETVSDTWSDYMDKYVKLRGDRLYFSNSAKLIFKALTGANFKPTDGLGKLLDSAGEIKKNLQYKSPRAVDHFEWMEKTLGELKDTMPKAFAGALKNGGQMRALVSELILKAIPNKIDEAKTAMEVLSVMKYGYTTSKTMDTLRADKELFTIFSDGNLSWNKNEGVKIVTGAMDQTMRAALLILGYTITIAGNAIRLNGSKFNGKTGRIKGAHDTWIADTNAKKTATQQQKAANETQKTDLENNLTRMRNRGLTENELDRYIDQYRQDIPILNQNLENQIRLLDQWLSANPTHSDVDTVANYLMQIQAGQNPTVPVVTDRAAEAHMKNISQIQGEIITRTKQLNRKINKRQEFENATQTIQMLNDQITKQNNALINWDNDHEDKYKKLMAYWDLLETGRDSHTGKFYSWIPGSAKKKQDKFNQNKNAIFASYLNNYSMVP